MDGYTNTRSLRAEEFNERRDCTVIALAATTGLPYPRCHQALSAVGRKNRRGIPFRKVVQKLAEEVDHDFDQVKRSGTLRRFVTEYPQGRFYVTIRGHAFAVLDGVINDNCRPRLGSIIKGAWRVTPHTPLKKDIDSKLDMGDTAHAQSMSINHTSIHTMTYGDSAALSRSKVSKVTSTKSAVEKCSKKSRAAKTSGVTNRAYSKKFALKLADECGKWWIKGRCRKEFLDQFEERCRIVLADMVKSQKCKGKSLRAI